MERENELEDELEKYKKEDKNWKDAKNKLEENNKKLNEKLSELETIMAANETKVNITTSFYLHIVLIL